MQERDVEFQPGERVKVVQRGTLTVGGLTLTNNTFVGVTIVRRNPDGSYQVRGIIRTPGGDEITVPSDWVQPMDGGDHF